MPRPWLLSVALFLCISLPPTGLCAHRLPFRTGSITAILPKRGRGSPANILPEFIGTLNSGQTVNWTTPCFEDNLGLIREKEEGFEINFWLKGFKSWTCIDVYAIATPFRMTGDYFYFSGHHHFTLPYVSDAEKAYITEKGISLFFVPDGPRGALKGLWSILPLLSDSKLGENAQIEFLKTHMNANFTKRKKPWSVDFKIADPSIFQSGDFIVLSKLRGTWGVFETLQKWVSGSWSGHSAMMIRDANNSLWVVESGHYDREGNPVIATIPFEEWWDFQLKDASRPLVAVIPLHHRIRKIFNSTAAWEVIRKMEGHNFGWHNIIFSWIDTPENNFPPPISAELVAAFTSIWSRVMPEYTARLYNEALNKRLGTEGLNMPEIMVECAARNMTFADLLSIPERDTWKYSDGFSTSCVAYVMTLWKAAGVFGDMTDQIQATEFTIRDAYMLNIFNDDVNSLPDWCQPGGERVSYCQIMGSWRFDLPELNTIEPYPGMNENCPSLPPDYYRPPRC